MVCLLCCGGGSVAICSASEFPVSQVFVAVCFDERIQHFGVCLVPESATTLQFPSVVYLPLTDTPPNFHVDLSCIYRKNDQSPILAAFLETVEEYKKTSPGSRR